MVDFHPCIAASASMSHMDAQQLMPGAYVSSLWTPCCILDPSKSKVELSSFTSWVWMSHFLYTFAILPGRSFLPSGSGFGQGSPMLTPSELCVPGLPAVMSGVVHLYQSHVASNMLHWSVLLCTHPFDRVGIRCLHIVKFFSCHCHSRMTCCCHIFTFIPILLLLS